MVILDLKPSQTKHDLSLYSVYENAFPIALSVSARLWRFLAEMIVLGGVVCCEHPSYTRLYIEPDGSLLTS